MPDPLIPEDEKKSDVNPKSIKGLWGFVFIIIISLFIGGILIYIFIPNPYLFKIEFGWKSALTIFGFFAILFLGIYFGSKYLKWKDKT